jgi:hypothetical protein
MPDLLGLPSTPFLREEEIRRMPQWKERGMSRRREQQERKSKLKPVGNRQQFK